MSSIFSEHRTGLIFAVLGAIAFSGKAIIVKLAYRYGVDAITLLMYRMLFALPLFIGMAWWASRGKTALSRRDWLAVSGLGFCGYYLGSYLDFAGLQYISASLERLILYLNPTLVLLLGVLLFGKAVSRRQIYAMAVSYSGVLLVFVHELKFEAAAQSSSLYLGATLVLASAMTYAMYLSLSGELVKRLGSLRLVGYATSVSCLLCIVQFLILRPLDAAQVAPQVIGLSVLNAVLCTAVPVLLLMMAVERIGASLSAQTGMIGPMSTIALGALILGEPFNLWILGGTALVLTGVFWVSKAK